MYGIIARHGEDGRLIVANKIFEMIVSDYFVSKAETEIAEVVERGGIINGGRFDMELCLRKFAEHYAEIYSGRDIKFLERECKFLFIMYITPLLNGKGFCHFESRLSDERRMDIVVDYGREQFIIELKIWRGEKAGDSAYKQLAGYLEAKKADAGYLLTFDFRKGAKKERRAEWVEADGKRIFDVIV